MKDDDERDKAHGEVESLDEPVSKLHDFRRAIDATRMAVAVLGERQKATASETLQQGHRIEQSVSGIKSEVTSVATRISLLDSSLSSRISALDLKVATLEERFHPVRNVVYGLVGLILVAVIAGLLALVVTKP